ncbi:MAG: zinc-ribbon domain-containing protein [Caldilineaceae bacterium]|nr:zinc-ribbon domain-containing protein [Caldilineaceae bacterium]
MIWLTITIALLLSLAALAFVLWPLFNAKVKPYHTENDELSELLVRKEGIMAAIKDLEFDHLVGKVSEEDYQRFDARLRRQAIVYMQQIEKIAPEATGLEDALEAEISRQRRTANGKTAAAPARVETPKVAVAAPTASSPRFCTTCGEPISSNHKFCANCGTPVASVPIASS